MSKTKHTPAPWRVATTGNYSNRVEADSGKRQYDGDNGYRTVCMFQSCLQSTMTDEEEANASANGLLISKSPELLAKLEALADAAERFVTDQGTPKERRCGLVPPMAINQAIDDARELIKQAKGEA